MTPLQMQPIAYDLAPKEGPKVVSTIVYWWDSSVVTVNPPNGINYGQVTINLQQQAQTQQFTTCQSAWIDNSTCPLAIKLISLETQQITLIQPFSQGFYPLFASTNVSFIVQAQFLSVVATVAFANNFLCGSTKFYFINAPCTPHVTMRTAATSASNTVFSQAFTILPAFGFITPALAVTVPQVSIQTPTYVPALTGVNMTILNNGPAAMAGLTCFILYSAGATTPPTGYNYSIFSAPISDSLVVPAFSFSRSQQFLFDPPIVLVPGASIWCGPQGSAPSGNTLNMIGNLQFSFYEIA